LDFPSIGFPGILLHRFRALAEGLRTAGRLTLDLDDIDRRGARVCMILKQAR